MLGGTGDDESTGDSAAEEDEERGMAADECKGGGGEPEGEEGAESATASESKTDVGGADDAGTGEASNVFTAFD